MASKGKKSPRDLAIDALNKITRAKPHPNELWGVIVDANDSLVLEGDSYHGGTPFAERLAKLDSKVPTIPDATFALIISTAVDQALELAITTHFRVDDATAERMFDETANGPLATFAGRIKTGHALGIYPRVARDELDLIRHIRNAFAHSWDKLDFRNQAVVDGCSQLRLPNFYKPNPLYPPNPFTAKSRILYSAQSLYVYLEWSGDGPMLYATHLGRDLFQVIEAAIAKE